MQLAFIHIQFDAMGWEGVSQFTEVVRAKRMGDTPMSSVRRLYGTVNELVDDRSGYTIERYLSDLLSRHARLKKDEVEYINSTCAAFAQCISLHKMEEPPRQ